MEADPDSNTILFQLLLLVFFTLMNAFFSGAEMAVVSVNRNRIRMLAEEGNKKALVIQGLFEDSTKFLSTIQVAITFAGFYSSASAASGIAPILASWMNSLHIPYSQTIANNGVTLLLMFFNLVFGELVPKRIAMQRAETFCMVTVMPIHYISIILSPFIRLLSVSTKAVLKLLRLKTEDEEEAVTEEEVLSMVKQGYENGTINDSEREMIDSVFAFKGKTAREIMVPRGQVFTLDIKEDEKKLTEEILKNHHSRIPVCEDGADNIIGILPVKEILEKIYRQELGKEEIYKLLRKPFFVPERKDAAQLFHEMQSERIHMAVLVDEYGGFSGIVTIEDLVEEIMGEIYEEFEVLSPAVKELNGGEYLIDGSMSLDELNEKFGLQLEAKSYDTLSGYLIEKLGYVPSEQSEAVVEEKGCRFIIENMERKRICSVRMQLFRQCFT